MFSVSPEIWQLWIYMKGRCWCICRTVYWQLSLISCNDFHQSLKPISSLKNDLNLWKRWEPQATSNNFFSRHIQECMKSSPGRPTDMATPESQQLWHDGFGWMFFFRGLWSVTWQFSAQFEQHGNQMNWRSVPAMDIGTCCMDMGPMTGVSTVSHTWGRYQHGMDLEPWGICDNFWPLKYLKSLKNVMLVESNEIFSNWMHSLLGSDLQSTDCIKSSVLLTLLPGEVSNFRSWNRSRDGFEKKERSPGFIRRKVLLVPFLRASFVQITSQVPDF